MREGLIYSRFYWHMKLPQKHRGLKNELSLIKESFFSSAEG